MRIRIKTGTIRIKKGNNSGKLINDVEKMAGVDLSACYQCRKCACGCPVSPYTQSPPAEIIRRLQLGAGEELLASDIIWTCSSCETCFARCPMEIDVASVMDSLRMLAVQRQAPTPQGDVPFFNRAFLTTVRLFGRTYDLAMIAGYKIRTATYMNDMDKFPIMLRKKKIAILPPRGANNSAVKRIFNSIMPKRG